MPRTYEPISSVTLSIAASSITISSIPSGFTDLRLVFNAFQPTGSGQQCLIRLNSDSGTNYSLTYLDANGSSPFTGRLTNQTDFAAYYVPPNGTSNIITSTIDFMSYSNININKTVLVSHGSETYLGRYIALWRSSSAINSISARVTTGGNLQPGSSMELYGIKAA